MSRESDKSRIREVNEVEGFISRWSRRKSEDRTLVEQEKATAKTLTAHSLKSDEESENQPKQLTDADMPPLDSLGENSDYSGFMSPKVSEELRTLALRKLFHLPQFNATDGLNDYDEDYTKFAKLGNMLTHDMRRLRELEHMRAMKAEYDEAEDVEHITAVSETSKSNQLEESAIDAEKTDSIGGGEKDKTPSNRD